MVECGSAVYRAEVLRPELLDCAGIASDDGAFTSTTLYRTGFHIDDTISDGFLFLDQHRLLVTFERFFVTAHAIQQATFLQVGDDEPAVGRDRAIAKRQGVLRLAEFLQRRGFLGQRFGMLRLGG